MTTGWLADNLSANQIVVLDATFFMPAQKRNAASEYQAAHIPGSRFFDIDAVADHTTDLPHMLPTAAQFSAAVGRLGIDNQTHVICTDSNNFMASARLWWTFRVFGHEHVSVLDGGTEKWRAENGALSSDPVFLTPKQFTARLLSSLVCDLEQMCHAQQNASPQILDARSPGRFYGKEAEPRAGVRRGHIPGSTNVHFRTLIDDKTLSLKPQPELAALFNIEKNKPIITTCGTGVTAAILALGLYELGHKDVAVYDGSWTEWGSRSDTPLATD